ncbi:hypothetical protein C0Q70_05440, partial [Pomacea canaliculata]
MADESNRVFGGFDFSTQQIKFIAVNDNLQVIYEEAVRFDSDLPHYNNMEAFIGDKDAFSVANSPVWMDSTLLASVRSWNAKLEEQKITGWITGSRAYERFTGTSDCNLSTAAEAYNNLKGGPNLLPSRLTFPTLLWSSGTHSLQAGSTGEVCCLIRELEQRALGRAPDASTTR